MFPVGSSSKIIGTGTDTVEGVSSIPPKSTLEGFLPISTLVEMYSRPYTPSLVGRTISDISVHMPSKPSPPNAPLYPIPLTGIFPVEASFHIVNTASGVQNESPSRLYSSDFFTVMMCGYSWTHLMHPTHLCFSGLNPPNLPPKTP